MTPEQLQYKKFKDKWPSLLPQRHEDSISDGIPDVSFVTREAILEPPLPPGVSGWVELKTLSAWGPKTTRIPHLRSGQVNWLVQRGRYCPHVYLLLWVRETDEWLWIKGGLVSHEMRDTGFSAAEWRSLAVSKR